jgi:hypothetical protein
VKLLGETLEEVKARNEHLNKIALGLALCALLG